jgi:hypothetical protein
MMLRYFVATVSIAMGLGTVAEASETTRVVEYNSDIRPILSENCFACHGPDLNSRKAKLRLDRKDGLQQRQIIVPGKPQESELFKRVLETDPAARMPPGKTGKSLTHEQIELLRQWIEQGAPYQDHWAFLPLRPPAVPAAQSAIPPVNAIDRFIFARLARAGRCASPRTDPRTLLRRLSFDLHGLPPTAADVEAFVADPSARAYEKLVDRMLLSPRFGERMAMFWLDLVRFADSEGYLQDKLRDDVYYYRDWVVDAFNRDMPFDQFTTEQLAGDLLPSATAAQRIASGYNRILQRANELGVNHQEYQPKFHADRVRNLATVWLALTFNCCECHDHKSDPFTTKEFYQLEAFFADIDDFRANPASLAPLLEEQKRINTEHEALREQRPAQVRKLIKDVCLVIGGTVLLPYAWTVATVGAVVQSLQPLKAVFASARLRRQGERVSAQIAEYKCTLPPGLVTEAVAPARIRVLPRGNWQDESGAIAEPDTPGALPPLQVSGRRPTRIDLAHWLTRSDNPLTARVFVNRLWMLLFGEGLVRTPGEFGAQGSVPTQPELLDWLAVEFQESGWNVKHIMRLIVLSHTYQQTSMALGDAQARRRDPANHLVGRQGRFRLPAEMIRDNALSVAGLLNGKVGGPSVKPYQPAAYWEHANSTWKDETGADQYRRGLYTFWRRTALHPSAQAFDAPTREECVVERARSNTPQQALVLLNDPTFVEAARIFAERIIAKGGNSAEGRIRYAMREALERPARVEEIALLRELAEHHGAQYRADPKAARDLLGVGHAAADARIEPCELAAWTSVAQVILNLHESITRY